MTYSIYRDSLVRAACSFAFTRAVKVGKKDHATLTEALEAALTFTKDNQTKVRVVQTPQEWSRELPYVEVWGNGTAKFMPRMLPLLLAELRTNQALAARAMASLGVL